MNFETLSQERNECKNLLADHGRSKSFDERATKTCTSYGMFLNKKIESVLVVVILIVNCSFPSCRYVLYKERNMLLTEKNLSRRKGLVFPQPERWKKVKRSMAAIKTVLGERKREKIAIHNEKMAERRLLEQEQGD